jgi:hypothetical protein
MVAQMLPIGDDVIVLDMFQLKTQSARSNADKTRLFGLFRPEFGQATTESAYPWPILGLLLAKTELARPAR